jgi:hypothetical protein
VHGGGEAWSVVGEVVAPVHIVVQVEGQAWAQGAAVVVPDPCPANLPAAGHR